MRPLLTLGSALLMVFAVAACESNEENLCEDECDCEGCSDHDFEVCLRGYDVNAHDAEIYGCEPYYDDWIACRRDTWYCDVDFEFETNCGQESSRFNACVNR
jgi:uncharacterized protein YfaQ (DUF2300 family)